MVDPTGHFADTLIDIGFTAYDFYRFVKNPSWDTARDLVLDLGSIVIPFVSAPVIKGGIKIVDRGLDIAKEVEWTSYGFKHFAPKNMPWNQVIESTKSGAAKYLPGTNVEALERLVWETGISTTNGRSWKVMDFEHIIGASGGKETRYIRVEMSSGAIHGHPITQAEYLKLIK